MPSYTLFAETADAYVTSIDAVYATARAGPADSLTASDVANIGQTFLGGNNQIHEYFLSFDLSGIPTSEIVDSVTLSLWITTDLSTSAEFTVEVRTYDWGTSVEVADFVAGADLAAKTLLASLASTSFVASAYNDLTAQAAFAAAVEAGGSLRMLLCSSRMTAGTAPLQSGSQFESMVVATSDEVHADEHRPRLVVTTTAALLVSPSGIGSGEAFGSPTLTPGPVSLNPAGIASGEAHGAATVTPGAVTLSPAGIASVEAFGAPSLAQIGVIAPAGIASAEAFGAATLTPGLVTVEPAGIPSAEAFGAPSVAQVIGAVGIPSAEAFGAPTVTPQAVTVSPPSIASAEAFGVAVLSVAAVTVSPSSIASAEAVGAPRLDLIVRPVGIPSAEAFGTPTLLPAPVTILPAGIASAEAFGFPTIIGQQTVTVSGIASAEAFGVATLTKEGAWESPLYDLSAVGRLSSTRVLWSATAPAGTVTGEASVNGGPWVPLVNGGGVPGLEPGQSTAGATIQVRLSLTGPDGPSATTVVSLTIEARSVPTVELAPLGVFMITRTDVSEAAGDLTIRVDGFDRARRVMRARHTQPYQVPAGTLYHHAIQDLIESRAPGQFTFRVTATAHTTPLLIFGERAEHDPWADAQAMAASCGMVLYFDPAGTCVLEPAPDPADAPTVWVFAPPALGPLTVDKSLDNETTYSGVIVTGEPVGADDPTPVRAVRWDTDPESPTYWLGSFGQVPYFLTSQFITSQEQADNAAEQQLRRVLGGNETVSFTAVPVPHLDVDKVIVLISERARVSGRYVIDALTVPLGHDQPMPVTCRERRLLVGA